MAADARFVFGADFDEADKEVAAFKKKIGGVQDDLSKGASFNLDTSKAQASLSDLTKTSKAAFAFDAAASFGGALSTIEEKAAESTAAVKKLQVQTGLYGDALEAAQDKARALFKSGVGETVAEATAAYSTASKALGGILDEQGVQDFTKSAAGIGKAYDKDVNEVIEKSRTFFKSFGLDGKKGGDLIALTMRDAGGAMDDVLDTLDEYSPLIDKAGFSAEQFAGTLTRGVQAGARDTDKLADAIKETQIRLQAGDISNTLKDIAGPVRDQVAEIVKAGEAGKLTVQQVLEKTATLTEDAFKSGKISEKMRSQLQVAVSGTPAEDIGSELYGRIFGAPIDTAAVEAQATKAGEDIAKSIEPTSVFAKLSKSFEVLKDKAATTLAPFISGAGSLLQNVASVGPGLTIMTEKLGGIAGISEKVKGLFSAGSGLFGLPPQALAIVGIVAVVAGGFVLLYNKSKTFHDAVDRLGRKLSELATKLWTAVKPVIEAVGNLFAEIASGALSLFIEGVELGIEVIGEIATSTGDFLADLFGFADAGELATKAMAAITAGAKFLTQGVDGIRLIFRNTIDAINSFGSAIGGIVESLFSLDFSGFVDKIAGAFEEAGAKARQNFNAIKLGAMLDGIDDQTRGLIEKFDKLLQAPGATAAQVETSLGAIASAVGKIRQQAIAAAGGDEKLIKRANDTYAEFIGQLNAKNDAWKKKTETTVPKITVNAAPVQKTLTDLSSQYLSLFRSAEQQIAANRIALIRDETAKRRAELDEQNRQQQAGFRDQIEGLKAQAAKAKEDETFVIDIVVDGNRVKATGAGAFKLLTDQIARLQKQADEAKRIALEGINAEALTGGVDKFLERLVKARTVELTIAQQNADAITGIDEAAIQQRLASRTALLALQQDNDLRAIAEGSDGFRAQLDATIRGIAGTGEATADQIAQAYQQVFDAFVASGDKEMAAVFARYRKLNAELAQTIADEAADLRASFGSDEERERAQALLGLKRAMQKELDAVGDNEAAKASIRLRYSQKAYDVEIASQRKTSALLSGTLAGLEKVQELFSESAIATRNATDAELATKLSAIAAEEQAVRRARKRGEIDAKAAADKLTEIAQRRADTEVAIEKNKLAAMDVVNQALAASFGASSTSLSTQFTKTIEDFGIGTKTMGDVLALAAGNFLTLVAEAGVQGEDLAKAAAKSAIVVAVGFLDAMIPIWSAQILGLSLATTQSVATLGAAGFAQWAALTGILKGIVGAAKSLALAQFHTGGVDISGPNGERGEFVARLLGGETVIDRAGTLRYGLGLKAIHEGRDPRDVAKYFVDAAGNLHRGDSSGIERRLERLERVMTKAVKETRRVADNYNSATSVDVRGEFKLTKGIITAQLKAARKAASVRG